MAALRGVGPVVGAPRLLSRRATARARPRGAVAPRAALPPEAADVASGAAPAAPLAAALWGLADAAAADATTQTDNGGGPFGFVADGLEAFLKVLDTGLEGLGVPYSYGFSIILLTVLVKAATFPLTKQQLQSTQAMQALAPRVKEIQARYANDTERLNMETSRLYKEAGVNPLAGCLPTLATLPVWIGLYRALSNVANEGLLTEGFFWIPSLAGPTTIADRTAGSGLAWLFPLQNGAPPVGWEDAGAYLVLPMLLVASQVVTMRLTSPPSDDPQQQQTQAILRFLPFMLGYFALNVPSGLTLYWFTNNILSTAQSAYLKSQPLDPEIQAAIDRTGVNQGSTAGGGGAPPKAVRVSPEMDMNPSRGSKFAELKAKEAAERDSGRGSKFAALKAQESTAAKPQQAPVATAAPPLDIPVEAEFTEVKSDATADVVTVDAAAAAGAAASGADSRGKGARGKRRGKGGSRRRNA